MTTATPSFRRRLRTGLIAAAFAGVVGTAAFVPAFAEERHGDWHDHGWRDRDDWRDRDHDRDGWRAPYVYATPGYYYAPAPAYVAPSLNFGFTIR